MRTKARSSETSSRLVRVRRGDAAFGGKRHADPRENRSALREHADRVELRCLARAGEGPDPAQEHAGE